MCRLPTYATRRSMSSALGTKVLEAFVEGRLSWNCCGPSLPKRRLTGRRVDGSIRPDGKKAKLCLDWVRYGAMHSYVLDCISRHLDLLLPPGSAAGEGHRGVGEEVVDLPLPVVVSAVDGPVDVERHVVHHVEDGSCVGEAVVELEAGQVKGRGPCGKVGPHQLDLLLQLGSATEVSVRR